MSRLYIGYNSQGPKTLKGVRKDATGEPLILLRENEAATCLVDLTGYLQLGETISSVALTNENVTATAVTASPKITLTISAAASHSHGSIRMKVTTSTGNVWDSHLVVRRPVYYAEGKPEPDYV